MTKPWEGGNPTKVPNFFSTMKENKNWRQRALKKEKSNRKNPVELQQLQNFH